ERAGRPELGHRGAVEPYVAATRRPVDQQVDLDLVPDARGNRRGGGRDWPAGGLSGELPGRADADGEDGRPGRRRQARQGHLARAPAHDLESDPRIELGEPGAERL